MSTGIPLSDAEKGRLEAALEAINRHADGALPRHLDAAAASTVLEAVALRSTLTLLASGQLANELRRRALRCRQVAVILDRVADVCSTAAEPCISQNVRETAFEEISEALSKTEGPR